MKVLSLGIRTAPSGNERPGQAVLPVPSRCGMAGTRDRHLALHCTGQPPLIFLPVTPVRGPGLMLRDMV